MNFSDGGFASKIPKILTKKGKNSDPKAEK